MIAYTHAKTYLTKMVELFANPISFVVMSFVTAFLVFIIIIIDDCKEILEKEHPQLYEWLKNDAAFDKNIGTVANFAGIQKW